MKPLALHKHADADDMNAWSVEAGGREPADYCSRAGAQALKEKIEAYWRERGHHVMIALHNVGFHPAIRAARYDVRSDMINGMPRQVAKGAPAPAPAPAEAEDFVEIDDDDLVFE